MANKVVIDIDFATKQALKKLATLEIALGRTEDGAQRIAKIDLGKKIKTGAIVATGAVVGLVGSLVALGKTAGDVQQVEVAFTTMLGSAEDALITIRELQEFATRTPFSIKGIETSAKQLLAVGIEVDNLIPTLKALGDVSAGLSVPLERLILNFGQVRSIGKLTGRELRDFTTAGVPLIAELAKQLNVSEAAIADLVSSGKIGFKDVERAFVSMTSAGGRFANLMDSQSRTIPGIFNNLTESLTIFARSVAKELTPALSTALTGFAEFIKRLASQKAVYTMVAAIGDLTKSFLDLSIVAVSASAALVNIFSPDIESKILDIDREVDKLTNTLAQYERRAKNSGDATGFYARQIDITKKRIADLEKQAESLTKELEKTNQGASLTNFLEVLQQARDSFASVALEAENAASGTIKIAEAAKRIPKEIAPTVGFSIDAISLQELAKNIRDFYETLSSAFTSAITSTFETVKNLTTGLQSILTSSLDSYRGTIDTISNLDLEISDLRNKLRDLTNGLSDEERLAVARELRELENQRSDIVEKQNKDIEDAAFRTITTFVSQIPVIGEALSGFLELARDPEAFKGLVTAITEALPGIIDGLVESIPQVVDVLISEVPKIIDTLIDGVPKLIVAIAEKAGDITTAIATKIPDIIRAFTDNLPVIITAIVDAIPEIIEAFIVELPDIAAAILELIPKIIIAQINGYVRLFNNMAGRVATIFIGAADRFVSFISEGLSSVFDPILNVLGPIFDKFSDAVQTIVDGFNSFADTLAQFDPSNIGQGGTLGKALGGDIGGAIKDIGGALGLASGGVVRVSGASGIRDTVPAMLADGELVVDNQTTQKLDKFLSTGASGDNSGIINVLTAILQAVSQPTQMQTSIDLDGKSLAKAITELKNTGQLRL